MSDSELRRLERLLALDPEDYALWGQYLNVGARIGAYDPMDWNSFVSWATKTPRPQVIAWEEHDRWYKAQDDASLLLHNIRNTHQQLPASKLAETLREVFDEVYSTDRSITIASAHGSYGDFPMEHVVINGSYRIIYDERSLFTVTPRSVLDMLPQYLIEVERQFAGSRWDPPDSEPVTVGAARDLKELVRELITFIENDENQEACYDSREEEAADAYSETGIWQDTSTDAYQRETFELIKDCLDTLFRKYRYASYLTSINIRRGARHLDLTVDNFHLHVSQKLGVVGDFKIGTNQSSDSAIREQPWQVVMVAWQSWIEMKLEQVLRLL